MFEIFMQKFAFPFWLVTRGMTLGVRAVLLMPDNHVLLVRHGYMPGWHFPGGGVEAGETLEQALKRECFEEAGVGLQDCGVLHGVFQNRLIFRRDHVAVFVLKNWAVQKQIEPNREIREAKLFPLENLPDSTSPGTRSRLAEIIGGKSPSPYWN